MERARIPRGRYSKEFREEAVRLVTEGVLSAGEASVRFSLAKSTLENWVRAAKKGKLGEIGNSHRPLTELEVEIRAAHRRTRETYGPERLQRDLADHGVAVGVHRIRLLRKKLGLSCKQKRRFKATRDSRHRLPVAENLLGQRFQASAPSQIWLTDITYIPTDEGSLYLAGYKDLYTRKIVGYAMGPRMTRNLINESLFRAVATKRPADPPLGSWRPVLFPGVSQPDRPVRNAGIHERQGELL